MPSAASCMTYCVMTDLEKLRQKYQVAPRNAKMLSCEGFYVHTNLCSWLLSTKSNSGQLWLLLTLILGKNAYSPYCKHFQTWGQHQGAWFWLLLESLSLFLQFSLLHHAIIRFIIPAVGFSLFSRSVVSDSLRPHKSHHVRPPCPSPTPGVYSNSCPSSR